MHVPLWLKKEKPRTYTVDILPSSQELASLTLLCLNAVSLSLLSDV
uniref:Uncharacterized protein n=1 Tax=Anguilla anguilla TaxID=7936 RepID=A0A0E9W0H6_ANGAN